MRGLGRPTAAQRPGWACPATLARVQAFRSPNGLRRPPAVVAAWICLPGGLHLVPGYGVTVDDMRDGDVAEQWVPAGCTLPTTEQPMRLAEFDTLFRLALRTVDRTGRTRLVLGLESAPGREAAVLDLTRREAECCSFFSFTLTDRGDLLLLEVAVPPAHVDVLAAVAERVARALGPAR